MTKAVAALGMLSYIHVPNALEISCEMNDSNNQTINTTEPYEANMIPTTAKVHGDFGNSGNHNEKCL
jgi:hypothetical protein